MAYRDEIDIDKLNERERDLINMIDRKIASGIEDSKNWRTNTTSEVLEFLNINMKNKEIIKNTFISDNEKIWATA